MRASGLASVFVASTQRLLLKYRVGLITAGIVSFLASGVAAYWLSYTLILSVASTFNKTQ